MSAPLSFHDRCQRIITAGSDPKQVRQVDYAVGYARAGLKMGDAAAVRVQAMYIVDNISSWRGDTAKQVRARLKEIAK